MSASVPTRWQVAAASVPGTGHRRRGQLCQDAHQCRELASGILIATAADGAGSASTSELGAALAAQTMLESLALACTTDPDDWLAVVDASFAQTRAEVIATAEAWGLPASEVATTLLAVVVLPDLVIAGQVGDGAIVIRQPDESLAALTAPWARSEYLNETNFLTSEQYRAHLQIRIEAWQATGIALLTDGLQMLALKMPQAVPHAAFFLPLLKLVAQSRDRANADAQLATFLLSPRVAERTDDDLTLVLAARLTGSAKESDFGGL